MIFTYPNKTVTNNTNLTPNGALEFDFSQAECKLNAFDQNKIKAVQSPRVKCAILINT
jgi:hypothetical protein